MKKFISMVMAAAMVVSLVPATAFAANDATFKVVKAAELTKEQAKTAKTAGIPGGAELQMKVTDVDGKADVKDSWDITLDLDGAEVIKGLPQARYDAIKKGEVLTTAYVIEDENDAKSELFEVKIAEDIEAEDTTIELTLWEKEDADGNVGKLSDGDIIVIGLNSEMFVLTSDNAGHEATVTVTSDFGDSDAMVFASVLEEGVKVTLKKVAEVAEEEVVESLESKLTIEAVVDTFYEDQKVELKLNSGFEWDLDDEDLEALEGLDEVSDASLNSDRDVLTLVVAGTPESIVIAKEMLDIEAVDAKVGDEAKITVKVKEGDCEDVNAWKATADAVVAAVVVGESVTLSVDEDEDVPVMYSGVNSDNDGINNDDSHFSLEVTIEESVAGALDVKDDLVLTLPEGVFVTEVSVVKNDWTVNGGTIENAFKAAYEEAEYTGFEFNRKTFVESTAAAELTFKLELIAVPGFVGDVVLGMEGDAIEAQEVTIATFVAPYTVDAQSNDLIIDYRNTEVPTDIVVTEAEAGLWSDAELGGLKFTFEVEKLEAYFEDDATYTVNEDDSDMEIKTKSNVLGFTVDKESDDEAAVVTISDIALYMSRSLPAGAYDLNMGTNAGYEMMTEQLWTLEDGAAGTDKYCVADIADWDYETVKADGNEEVDALKGFVAELGTVKEGFINIVTAGRDADDASFTTKVVVPVGESYIVAGEETVALDVPAYVSAAGYTMLPVRAVAVALGIHTNNVLWDQATKTVTILYGQRIITMTVGSKVINVNGSAIPASASPEVVDGRTFLPMRDLATALGVTDITWDAATKTATLNGNK